MIRQSLVPIAILATSVAALAAPADADPATKQLRVYPKNLARHHVGANVFLFNATSQSYTTTEAAAAWLDDDITTGWAPLAGKQHYLLALPEPEVITNFSVSTRSAAGKVTLYGGDEPAAPGAKSWVPLVRDVPVESINEKKLGKPISRLTKYVLIETEIADPAPLFSLYLFGERPATSYTLTKRDQPLDTKAVFGPYTNDQTAFNQTSLYAGGRVAFSTDKANYTSWQKAIDDNPESFASIMATKDDAGLAIALSGTHKVNRLALLTSGTPKGKLEVFLAPALPSASPALADATTAAAVQPVANTTTSAIITQAVPLTGLTPAAIFDFDGSTTRISKDFTGSDAGALLLRWTPENGTDSLAIRELNAFDGMSLADYGLGLKPDAIAELAEDASKDGKAFADGKAGKGLEPVGEMFGSRKPYLPPSLGFPPPIPPRVPPNIPPSALSN
jgi:hypothetical protein